ncbi:hypothetical protein [Faecalibacter sp. LW9]|uniref:hypothetical protein n=1 Tax=Faecalibacter sp. LW9 TaxID=3103144 RepID=UPI002B002402|nr:hypothetical protein [Faecalibacter sp. LW9]
MQKFLYLSLAILFFNCKNSDINNKQLIKEIDLSIKSSINQIDIAKQGIYQASLHDKQFYSIYKQTQLISQISDSIYNDLISLENKIKEDKEYFNNNNFNILFQNINSYSKNINKLAKTYYYDGTYMNLEIENFNENEFNQFFSDNYSNQTKAIKILKNRIKERERELYFMFMTMKLTPEK